MKVRVIPFDEIDIVRWNSCVHYATNGNIFGYYWFLKNTVKEFDALVEGNYESVMPLLYSTNRWGQKILQHPDFLGRLGIFSIHVLSPPRVQAFLDAIPVHYRSQLLLFNELIRFPRVQKGYEQEDWFRLPLDQPYEIISSLYDESVYTYIQRTHKHGLQASSHLSVEEYTAFLTSQQADQNPHLWHRIHYNLQHRGIAFATAYIDRKGKVYAVGLFCYSHGYFVNLYFAAREEWKEALFYRMSDDLIRLHAERPLQFDFNRLHLSGYHPKRLGAINRPLQKIDVKSTWDKIWDQIFPNL